MGKHWLIVGSSLSLYDRERRESKKVKSRASLREPVLLTSRNRISYTGREADRQCTRRKTTNEPATAGAKRGRVPTRHTPQNQDEWHT
jgi:hypothetical protein